MGYTVIGDGVNIAARLEAINKEYGTRLCISHSVFREAGERLCVRPIDEVAVKGRRSKIAIYELLGAFGAGPQLEPEPEARRLSRLSYVAHEARVREDLALALRLYNEILVEFPDDPVARELVRRLEAAGSVPGSSNTPPANAEARSPQPPRVSACCTVGRECCISLNFGARLARSFPVLDTVCCSCRKTTANARRTPCSARVSRRWRVNSAAKEQQTPARHRSHSRHRVI